MSKVINQDISIGHNLKALRLRANLSQEEVATKLQVLGISTMSREIISQMELGRHNIRVTVLLALKEVYKVDSFDEFFEDISL
ncbi:helix-turn-helix domain-containing protein [Lachnoclostridium sp. An118]|uniref:helix-turn-helix domain-containing protein n=1 Tax=Lachnoclostridium sp. An118 TaxID=1965547 RepID=UPI000B391DDE|nr:helix-turn-helix transcriptional regulator [Lachnoclostridium sp. An118]OUQ51389.1 transcriptional regulator [Lachnoclostridium sp. An118]